MRPILRHLARTATRIAAPGAAALALAAGARAQAPAPAPDLAAPDDVVSAMQELESQRDAKCHSTASRFEDFLFGTPLSAPARRANVELQKRLVRQLWREGGAAAAGAARIEPAHLAGPVSARVVLETGADGFPRVVSPEVPEVPLAQTRARQYASIAYSLRAILGVEQDAFVTGGEALLPLAPESIDLLREALDAVSLAVLAIADREARARSEYEVSEPVLRGAWKRLLPDIDAPEPDTTAVADADARQRALAALDRLVEAKTQAYRAYNSLDDDWMKLLVFNISRFYARQPLTRLRKDRRELVAELSARLDAFAGELLRRSAELAADPADPLIRAAAAEAALQRLQPHTIDEYEDVHVFGRLPLAERVTLEAYDCDSFRDFGLHWRSLERAAHAAPAGAPVPDPFAAEILVEGISSQAVLLLRVAGQLADADPSGVRLDTADLVRAVAVVEDRASRYHAAPPPATAGTRIASAPGAAPGAAAGRWFHDVTAESGVRFAHRSARWLGEFRHKQMKTPPTFSGGGVASEDVDGDGDMDLLFVGGAGNALLLNDGRGRFTDVTAAAGIAPVREDGSHGEPRAPLVADFDNDGIQDVLVTYVDDDHRLFRGVGGARFQDVSAASGLGGRGLVGGPATTFDFDGDGLLDVYVGYFGDYLHGALPAVDRDNQNALPNRLFRNLGGMRFADVTEGSGAADTGWTQAVSHVDFDRDGRQDIVVANDYGKNAFLRNLGGGRFENVARRLGIDRAFHSMNVGVADLNDDDLPDIYISNIAMLVKDDKYVFPDVNTPLEFDLRSLAGMLVKESDILYLSQAGEGGLAAYVPSRDIERGATSTGWAWDAEFFDFDHDGDDDLYLVNGTNDFNVYSMVYRRFHPDGRETEAVLDYGSDTNVFFENEGGKLRNRSERSGADLPLNSRSTAYLDFEGDGDLDVAVNNFHAPATLLRNDAAREERGWLALRLVGDPARGSSRDAIGARVTFTLDGGRHVRRWVQGGSGYLSMNPKQMHVGLGAARAADATIVWPNGEVQALAGLAAGRVHVVRQGERVAEAPAEGVARAGR
jgi:hypothetical protein